MNMSKQKDKPIKKFIPGTKEEEQYRKLPDRA
jgi:hypothetical protein